MDHSVIIYQVLLVRLEEWVDEGERPRGASIRVMWTKRSSRSRISTSRTFRGCRRRMLFTKPTGRTKGLGSTPIV